MPRARDLGIRIGELQPGPLDAITDVAGTRVGHTTIVEGEDVRTGVTVVVPGELPAFAGTHRLNGNGELTGLEWVRESGLPDDADRARRTRSPSASCATRSWRPRTRRASPSGTCRSSARPTTACSTTSPGCTSKPEHVDAALAAASDGPVDEGAVGSGTGMICHGFKGGIGTASRVTNDGYTVGVLVQANHGRRPRLSIDGVPVGRELGPDRIPVPARPDDVAGSIIVLVATDAPLLPHQCDRVAQRAAFGIARTGGAGENSSGDLILAWSTANSIGAEPTQPVTMLANERIDQVFYGAIEATEEAIVNALLAAETTTGKGGATAHRLDHDLLREALA